MSSCAPLEIWSCEELETVEALLTAPNPKDMDMTKLIIDKLLTQYYGNVPMGTYIYDKYKDVLTSNTYLDTKTDEMVQIVRDTLSIEE